MYRQSSSEWIMAELEKAGSVILNKHFVYKSKKHGPGYINMDPAFPNVTLMTQIGHDLTTEFWGQFETIAAPATGGIVLALFAAAEAPLGRGDNGLLKYPPAVWADKDGDDFRFERDGFLKHVRGKKVLVVEDLLTTGGSVIKVCRQIEKHEGEVVGVSSIVNRGGVTAEQLGVPRLECLANVSFSAVPAKDCGLCHNLVPIVEDIGHGAEFKAAFPDYAGGYERLLEV